MKKIITGILIVLVLGSTGAYAAAKYGIFEGITKTPDKIYINGEIIKDTDSNGNPIVAGITKNNQTFVSLRGIVEEAGFGISWNPGSVNITTPSTADLTEQINQLKNVVKNLNSATPTANLGVIATITNSYRIRGDFVVEFVLCGDESAQVFKAAISGSRSYSDAYMRSRLPINTMYKINGYTQFIDAGNGIQTFAIIG